MKYKKIKVCHIVSTDITLKFLLLPQLKFLMGRGYDVYAVCSLGKLTKAIEQDGIKVKTIEITRKISPIKDIFSLWQLYWYFKKEKFTIVHTHAPKPGLLGQLAAKMAGVPIIINTVHGLYFTENSPYFKRKFFILMEKIAANCSNLIFSQNKEDIDTIIKERIAKPNNIRYLGNGINLEKFNAKKFPENFILQKKKELRINPDVKIIGMVGRLVREKGYLELFEAMRIVLKQYPHMLLLVIGPEEPLKKGKFNPEIVKHYGIENNVTFLGERKDVDELYPLMDIFVLPSWREGLPRSVIEAMAMQKPIIVTDIRGCREEIEHGKNGMVIPAKNFPKLAESILFLLENPEKAKEYAENANLKARAEFDENVVFNRIQEAYQKLLKEKLLLGNEDSRVIDLKKLKICHVTTVGITLRFIVLDFLDFLKKENGNVYLVCSYDKWTPFLKDRGFGVHNIKMTRRITPVSDLVSLLKLFLYFRKEKFDIVHTYTPKAGVLGRIAARLAGVPVVIHASFGFYIGVQIPKITRNLITFAEKTASYFCDLVFSQNREDIQWAISKKIISPKKIKLLTYGINTDRFDPSKFSGDFILTKKKELGIEGKLVIGMVGRFVKEKGYLDLFNAFKIIKKEMPNVVLLLVAPEDKEKEDALDKSVLEEYGIEKDVVLLGYKHEVSDIEKIYSLMDVFVLPSYREGLSMSLLEAQSMQKPVVATDIRGCRESVDSGNTGMLVPLKNPEKLAEVIVSLLSNVHQSAQMGKRGRQRVSREFNEMIIFDKIKEEYQVLLKKKLKR